MGVFDMHQVDLHEGNILVTGAAGFIGAALSERLLSEGCRVIGIDSLNDYYSVSLKGVSDARKTLDIELTPKTSC